MTAFADVVVPEADERDVITERDAAEDAIAELDRQTGGDGEYVFSTLGDTDATPAMKCRSIGERYAVLADERARLLARVERLRRYIEAVHLARDVKSARSFWMPVSLEWASATFAYEKAIVERDAALAALQPGDLT